MPRPVGYGRPGTKVIPDDWQANQTPVVENSLDCTITIAPAGGAPDWNNATEQMETPSGPTVYDGTAAITPSSVSNGASHPTVAEDVVTVRDYTVKLEHSAAGIEVGHVITVGSSPDPDLPAGHQLKVTAVEKSSRHFSRVLRAVDAT